MINIQKAIFIFILFSFFFNVSNSIAQSNKDERHIKVAMRMIGHEILLASGDSVSRVLAIEKELDRYKIRFDTEFIFHTDKLINEIDTIVQKMNISNKYIIELEQCETHEVVYNFERDNTISPGMIPCRSRPLPKDCYVLYFTIMDSNTPLTSLSSGISKFSNTVSGNSTLVKVLLSILMIIFGLYLYFWNRERKVTTDSNLILLGDYKFDSRNMTLSYKGELTELTSKESELLLLLYTSVNTTLERETILKQVWGDEGDYVGRTLDVFISKLRKRLVADPTLKIINIRGVGYKFVVNDII